MLWDAPFVRVLNAESGGWRVIEQPDNLHGPEGVERAIADVVDALASGASRSYRPGTPSERPKSSSPPTSRPGGGAAWTCR